MLKEKNVFVHWGDVLHRIIKNMNVFLKRKVNNKEVVTRSCSRKSCSYKFHKFHRKVRTSESPF